MNWREDYKNILLAIGEYEQKKKNYSSEFANKEFKRISDLKARIKPKIYEGVLLELKMLADRTKTLYQEKGKEREIALNLDSAQLANELSIAGILLNTQLKTAIPEKAIERLWQQAKESNVRARIYALAQIAPGILPKIVDDRVKQEVDKISREGAIMIAEWGNNDEVKALLLKQDEAFNELLKFRDEAKEIEKSFDGVNTWESAFSPITKLLNRMDVKTDSDKRRYVELQPEGEGDAIKAKGTGNNE